MKLIIHTFQTSQLIHEQGGRFLKRTKVIGVGPGHFAWKDIGEQRAYEKACQALRENAPEVRKQLAVKEMNAVKAEEDRNDISERFMGKEEEDDRCGP